MAKYQRALFVSNSHSCTREWLFVAVSFPGHPINILGTKLALFTITSIVLLYGNAAQWPQDEAYIGG